LVHHRIALPHEQWKRSTLPRVGWADFAGNRATPTAEIPPGSTGLTTTAISDEALRRGNEQHIAFVQPVM
jgi:hypothetical protein